MSPEIQEWSHKSRSRINNLYLLTRPITETFEVISCIVLSFVEVVHPFDADVVVFGGQ